MIYEVEIDGKTFEVEVLAEAGGYSVSIDGGEAKTVDVCEPSSGVWSVLSGGLSYEVGLQQVGDAWNVDIYGSHHEVRAIDPRRKALRLAGGSDQGLLKTSMPGRVVRLLVEEGQSVVKGDPMSVVEAMKMENEMKAPADGQVAKIFVTQGVAVEAGASLILVE